MKATFQYEERLGARAAAVSDSVVPNRNNRIRVDSGDPSEVAVFERMIEAMVVKRDVAAFRSVIEEVGLLKRGAPFTDEQVEGYFGHFYEFVLEDEPSTMTPEYATESVRRLFDANGPNGEILKAANVPPSFVIIQRINMGLYAIVGQLYARANWRRIANELWPFVNGPPSTPLGEEEAAWLAAQEQTA